MSGSCKRLGAPVCYGCDDDGSLGINNAERINRLKHPGRMAKKEELRRRMLEILLSYQSLIRYPASSLEEGTFDVSEFRSLVVFDNPSAISVKEGNQDVDGFLGLDNRRMHVGHSRSTESLSVGTVYHCLGLLLVVVVVLLIVVVLLLVVVVLIMMM